MHKVPSLTKTDTGDTESVTTAAPEAAAIKAKPAWNSDTLYLPPPITHRPVPPGHPEWNRETVESQYAAEQQSLDRQREQQRLLASERSFLIAANEGAQRPKQALADQLLQHEHTQREERRLSAESAREHERRSDAAVLAHDAAQVALSNAREDARRSNMQQIGLSNKAAADEKAERARREKQLAIAEERRLLEQAQAASKSPW